MTAIKGFHAHIYFDEFTVDQATALCEQAKALFSRSYRPTDACAEKTPPPIAHARAPPWEIPARGTALPRHFFMPMTEDLEISSRWRFFDACNPGIRKTTALDNCPAAA